MAPHNLVQGRNGSRRFHDVILSVRSQPVGKEQSGYSEISLSSKIEETAPEVQQIRRGEEESNGSDIGSLAKPRQAGCWIGCLGLEANECCKVAAG